MIEDYCPVCEEYAVDEYGWCRVCEDHTIEPLDYLDE